MKTKKMKNKFFTILALVAVMAFTSCSNNDDNEAPKEELSEVVMQEFAESINQLTVPSGLSNSNNSYAQQANSQFTALKSLGTSFSVLFNIPANVTSSKSFGKIALDEVSKSILNTKTYTWSSDGTTITYTISETSDRYNFSYSISSSSLTGKIMDGYQLKDGSYAEAKLYSDNTVVSTIKWWVTASTTKIELDSQGLRMVLESNTTDNSGSLKVYDGATLFATYTWASNGSGSYVDHINNQTFTW